MELALVEQFLNTLDQRSFSRHGSKWAGGDNLTSVAALAAWLGEHGLGAGELTSKDLDTAIALRTTLRQALGGGADTALGFELRLVPDANGGLRIAAATGVPGLDVIVETVAASVASGGWARMKLCAAEDCRWAFYDASRNGRGRWCSMDVCGNRAKTRAYRLRHVG